MGPLKQCLEENISLQRCNCNLFGLTDTVALFAKEAGFFSDLGCSSGQVLSKTKSVTPHFFTFLTSLTHHLSMVKFAEKIIVRKFSREHLYAISAFKISSYYCIKVLCFCCFYEKYVFFSRPLFKNDLRENYILSLNKPRTSSYGLGSSSSYVSAKLRECAT